MVIYKIAPINYDWKDVKMNFIKKVLVFLLVMVMFIAQFDVDILEANECNFGKFDNRVNNTTIGYFIDHLFEKILWIGFDPYDCDCRCKFFKPYGGYYLTLNGTKFDDFSGQIDVDDPSSLSNLGEKCLDNIVITTNPSQKFYASKCLDTLASLLREGGIITIPVWLSQINSLVDTFRLGVGCKMISWKCKITWEELERLGDFLFSYNDVELCAIDSNLLPAIKKAIKDIYKCNFDFEIVCCRSAVYYKMQNMGFFLGNLLDADPYSTFGFDRLRYIVTLRPF